LKAYIDRQGDHITFRAALYRGLSQELIKILFDFTLRTFKMNLS